MTSHPIPSTCTGLKGWICSDFQFYSNRPFFLCTTLLSCLHNYPTLSDPTPFYHYFHPLNPPQSLTIISILTLLLLLFQKIQECIALYFTFPLVIQILQICSYLFSSYLLFFFSQTYPMNPNGSPLGIAALCSEDGRHLGKI